MCINRTGFQWVLVVLNWLIHLDYQVFYSGFICKEKGIEVLLHGSFNPCNELSLINFVQEQSGNRLCMAGNFTQDAASGFSGHRINASFTKKWGAGAIWFPVDYLLLEIILQLDPLFSKAWRLHQHTEKFSSCYSTYKKFWLNVPEYWYIQSEFLSGARSTRRFLCVKVSMILLSLHSLLDRIRRVNPSIVFKVCNNPLVFKIS